MTGISTVHKDIRELQLEEKVILDPKDTATALNDYFVDSSKPDAKHLPSARLPPTNATEHQHIIS